MLGQLRRAQLTRSRTSTAQLRDEPRAEAVAALARSVPLSGLTLIGIACAALGLAHVAARTRRRSADAWERALL